VRVFRQKITLEDANGSHACSLGSEQACDQWRFSRVSTFLTSSHCKLRPNTEGLCYAVMDWLEIPSITYQPANGSCAGLLVHDSYFANSELRYWPRQY
jgi:hypothetical protein